MGKSIDEQTVEWASECEHEGCFALHKTKVKVKALAELDQIKSLIAQEVKEARISEVKFLEARPFMDTDWQTVFEERLDDLEKGQDNE